MKMASCVLFVGSNNVIKIKIISLLLSLFSIH